MSARPPASGPHVGVLAAASERLRGVPGFPRRRGRPRKHGDKAVTGAPQASVPASLPDRAPASPTIEPRLLTVEQAAVYLGLGDDTVRSLVGRGVLKRVRVPAPWSAEGEVRKILLDRLDLDAQIAAWRDRP